MVLRRLLIVAALPLLVAAGRGSVPNLDIKTTCHASGAAGLGAGIDQSEDACLRDERGARDELVKMWPKVPAAIRETCSNEVHIGGSPSYVELLTCAQMNEWSKTQPTTTPSRAAGAPAAGAPLPAAPANGASAMPGPATIPPAGSAPASGLGTGLK